MGKLYALTIGMPYDKPIEYGGVGQSGYAAGRHAADLALETEMILHNEARAREEQLQAELGTDDRFRERTPYLQAP